MDMWRFEFKGFVGAERWTCKVSQGKSEIDQFLVSKPNRKLIKDMGIWGKGNLVRYNEFAFDHRQLWIELEWIGDSERMDELNKVHEALDTLYDFNSEAFFCKTVNGLIFLA